MERYEWIETQRLRIRPATKEQMEAVVAGETDEELKAAYTQMLEGSLRHPEQWLWYAIWTIARKDGVPVGDLCFKGFNPDGSVEIGYGIAERYRGQGYASEAVMAAVDWALRQPCVTRVEAETEPNNRISQRVLEKCGFVPNGLVGEEGPRFVKHSAAKR